MWCNCSLTVFCSIIRKHTTHSDHLRLLCGWKPICCLRFSAFLFQQNCLNLHLLHTEGLMTTPRPCARGNITWSGKLAMVRASHLVLISVKVTAVRQAMRWRAWLTVMSHTRHTTRPQNLSLMTRTIDRTVVHLWSHCTVIYTVSQKNNTDAAHYNFKAHQLILIILPGNSYGVWAIINLFNFSCLFAITSLMCWEITKAEMTYLSFQSCLCRVSKTTLLWLAMSSTLINQF